MIYATKRSSMQITSSQLDGTCHTAILCRPVAVISECISYSANRASSAPTVCGRPECPPVSPPHCLPITQVRHPSVVTISNLNFCLSHNHRPLRFSFPYSQTILPHPFASRWELARVRLSHQVSLPCCRPASSTSTVFTRDAEERPSGRGRVGSGNISPGGPRCPRRKRRAID